MKASEGRGKGAALDARIRGRPESLGSRTGFGQCASWHRVGSTARHFSVTDYLTHEVFINAWGDVKACGNDSAWAARVGTGIEDRQL
jgi:hypothetical protein